MAYFLVATRDMPKSRAMARRDSPCFLAFFTVSQRACWAGGGMRVHLVAHRLDLSAPPLAGCVLDPGPLIHRGVQGDQELPLVLTQVAAGLPPTASGTSPLGKELVPCPHKVPTSLLPAVNQVGSRPLLSRKSSFSRSP